MALAEQKLKSVSNSASDKQAANSIVKPAVKKGPKKAFVLVLILGLIVGVALTYSAMQLTVVKPLQEAVAFERAQKADYITANELDFKSFQPRLQALEVSNAAKAEKEAILLKTIKDLQNDLKAASKKVLAAEKNAQEQIKAAKVSAIEALQN